MNAAVVDTWAGFDELKPEWNGLLERSRADTVFLSWEWMKAWSEVMSDKRAAFHRHRSRRCRPTGGHRAVLHDGDAPAWPASLSRPADPRDYPSGAEYGDWIQAPEREEAVAHATIQMLQERRAEWDCIWMPNVAGWTGAKERVFDSCRGHGWYAHARSMVFAAFDLPPTWDAYLGTLSSKKRKDVRALAKRFERSPASFIECTSPVDLPRYLGALFDLHHARWSRVGDDGVFRRRPREAAFYRAFTPRALERGWLRFFAIEERGRIRATQIGYSYAGVFHALQEGYDPDADAGMGNVLRARVIERCILERLKAYDFLGTMTDHKRRWAAQEREGGPAPRPSHLEEQVVVRKGGLANRQVPATRCLELKTCASELLRATGP